MSDITLINMSIAKQFGQKVFCKKNSAGVFSLIAALEKSGFEVTFHEHFLDHSLCLSEEINHFLSLIESSSNLIGIGCHSIHLPFVVLVVEKIKELFPEKKVILGGIGPSSVAKELMKTFNFIDAVVIGEGEHTLCELTAKKTGNFKGIKGLAYQQNGDIFTASPREPTKDLDSLPIPEYRFMDFGQYEIPTVITARGCTFGCAFCSLSSFWEGRVRYRSIDNVMQELRLLTGKYGIRYVFFGDPTFVINRDRTIEFCHRLREENLGLKWECLVRVDLMDEELMEQMSRSGCEAVFYGIESGSDDVLARIKRGITVDTALEAIHKSAGYFKNVEVSLMWGFPFETMEDFQKTLQLLTSLKEKHYQVHFRWLEPYPATPLYERYKKDLFCPEEISFIYQPALVEKEILKVQKFYEYELDGADLQSIRSYANISSVRTVIAASHIVNMAKQLIKAYPNLFCDYYRYKTPNLKEKIHHAQRYSLY